MRPPRTQNTVTFGDALASTGTDLNSLLCAGRESSANGLYYYRARYYDPFSGRLLSEEPLGFEVDRNFYVLDEECVSDEVCACCGTPCKIVSGFVHKGEATRVGYVVRIVPDYPDHDLVMALGIGAWGEGTSKKTRVLVCSKVKFSGDGKMSYDFVHPDSTPWVNDEILGVKVPAEFVKGDVESETTVLADFILDSDKRIYELLPSH